MAWNASLHSTRIRAGLYGRANFDSSSPSLYLILNTLPDTSALAARPPLPGVQVDINGSVTMVAKM